MAKSWRTDHGTHSIVGKALNMAGPITATLGASKVTCIELVEIHFQ
jgi:hypothetical protein